MQQTSLVAAAGTRSLADQADPHRLYELSVQCPEAEVDFIDKSFRLLRGRSAHLLREDFCGTASVCCEWVKRRKANRAFGVDIDREVVDWGRRHNLSKLPDDRVGRVTLLEQDVLEVETRAPDIISAMNFSYWLLKDRTSIKRYFERVRGALKEDGIFFLDAYGGYDSFRVITEERQIEGDGADFTYVWEQEQYDPITGRLVCHIHFAFPDGSRQERAFSYDWRLWTLPEIRELLAEAGFSRVICYWQGWDENGEPDGLFVPAEEGEPDAGWIAYLTAEK
ncbi:MAG: class I SAM-dependent methyltransferase [Pseudomonadota bacterium]|nr:class I SAM-dependent methyltransferase [Pseudomonadota bacterium]